MKMRSVCSSLSAFSGSLSALLALIPISSVVKRDHLLNSEVESQSLIPNACNSPGSLIVIEAIPGTYAKDVMHPISSTGAKDTAFVVGSFRTMYVMFLGGEVVRSVEKSGNL